jgi:type I restriction-modification system DNA methylase subunit
MLRGLMSYRQHQVIYMTENLELEKNLWQAADKLRSNMDAAEYKHVALAEQMQKAKELDETIKLNLAKIGYGF